MAKTRDSVKDAPRQGRVRRAGDLVGAVGGVAFKRFGFVQAAVVERWVEIVGERYAKHSVPEAIRFPAGKKSNGTLHVVVEGAHAPLMQHMAPMIVERVNRFFGYPAVGRLAWRQGRVADANRVKRPTPVAEVPEPLGEGLRNIADPELRACLEALACGLAASSGAPGVDRAPAVSNPTMVPLRSIKIS